jgi:soluble lytic murein transglycosylase-like protein
MTKRLVILLTFAATVAVAQADERKFSAADVPAVKLNKSGRIVVKNTSSHITAYRFFGDIREALVSLRATRRVISRPFGDSNASVRAVPAHYLPIISEAALQHGVDPRLVAEVVRRESAFNSYAVSSVGASGLMQLMPATARFLGVTDVFDARQNIFGGTRYLRTLLDTFNGDLDLALAAYNAGPGAVRKFNGVPPYRETKAYVAAIRANYERQLRASQPGL